jgi:predicted AlkP superfamily pyrophosphatase or phosphodiesterase
MTVSNPSVTWPNHTSLMTGVHADGHGVLFNGLLVRGGPGQPVAVDPRRDQSELVAVPTIFDAAHAAGLSTAAINWPCTRKDASIDDDFPDTPETFEHMTPRLKQGLMNEGILSEEIIDRFNRISPAARDEIWTEAACHVIRARQPRLLAFHLLNVDAVHHRHGPRTWAGASAVAVRVGVQELLMQD